MKTIRVKGLDVLPAIEGLLDAQIQFSVIWEGEECCISYPVPAEVPEVAAA